MVYPTKNKLEEVHVDRLRRTLFWFAPDTYEVREAVRLLLRCATYSLHITCAQPLIRSTPDPASPGDSMRHFYDGQCRPSPVKQDATLGNRLNDIELLGKWLEVVEGPDPRPWLKEAASQSSSALQLGSWLWALAFAFGERTVCLQLSHFRTLNLSHGTGDGVLTSLENAGLVEVERELGRDPVVTILDPGETQ